MSCWSHIYAIVLVEENRLDEMFHFKDSIQYHLKIAPKITGLEDDAEITPVMWRKTTWQKDDDGDIPDTAYLAIVGALRGRESKQVKDEYKQFIKFLKDKGYTVTTLTRAIY